MNDQKNDALVGKLIWRTLLPQFTTELSLSMTSIIDGIIVGNFYGKRGLAAVGLGAPIISVFIITAGVIGTGNSVICASLFGKSSQKGAGRVFSLSLIWSAILSVILTLVCTGLAGPIALLFGGKNDISLIPDVADYIRGFSLGAGFIIFRQLLAPMVNMEGGNRFIHVSSFAILISDFIGDYISCAYFDMGTFGLGAASALSYVFGCMTLVLFYMRKKSGLKVDLKNCFSLSQSAELLKEGFPTALKRLCDLVAPVLTNRFIMSIASVGTMAAMSVQNSATKFPLCLVLSLSTMVLMLSGTFYHESDRMEMEEACRKMLLHTVLWSVFVSIIFFVFATPLANFFLEGDQDVTALSAYAIRWYVAGIPALALNQCAAYYLQAVGNLKISNIIMIVDRLVTTVILVYILGWLMGEKGIFIAYGVSEILLTLILYVLLCIKNKGPVTKISQILFLPDDYGVSEENMMTAVFSKGSEAVGISEKVGKFCKEHGIDDRRAYYASLCTEELAVNVVTHGFSSKNRKLSVRVFIGKSEDKSAPEVTIRFRDNGKPFDLVQRDMLAKAADADPAANVGIRIVFGIAKNVSYNMAYGMNNTVITL